MIKHTLQEFADFFDMALAVDRSGDWFLYSSRPYVYSRGWKSDNSDFHYTGRIARLVNYFGDWRDSLTLPASWTNAPPFKHGELVVHIHTGYMYPWSDNFIREYHRRPTDAEWKQLKGEE